MCCFATLEWFWVTVSDRHGNRVPIGSVKQRGRAHLTVPEMNSGFGAPSGPGAKSSVARAADMNAYTVAPASATHGTAASPKAEHGRVGVEGTLSAKEGFRAERIRHSRSAFDVLALQVNRSVPDKYEVGKNQRLLKTNEPLGMK